MSHSVRNATTPPTHSGSSRATRRGKRQPAGLYNFKVSDPSVPACKNGHLRGTKILCRLCSQALIAAAVLLLSTVALHAQDAGTHLKSGADSLQRGDLETAIRECKAALAADPGSAAGHMLLGQAYLAQHSVNMIAEAKAELQQALDLDPNLFWARFYLAKIYIDLGLNEKAKEQLERGLKERPGVPYFISLLREV